MLWKQQIQYGSVERAEGQLVSSPSGHAEQGQTKAGRRTGSWPVKEISKYEGLYEKMWRI